MVSDIPAAKGGPSDRGMEGSTSIAKGGKTSIKGKHGKTDPQ